MVINHFHSKNIFVNKIYHEGNRIGYVPVNHVERLTYIPECHVNGQRDEAWCAKNRQIVRIRSVFPVKVFFIFYFFSFFLTKIQSKSRLIFMLELKSLKMQRKRNRFETVLWLF